MDLKGAEIRNISQLCMEIGSNTNVPLKIRIPIYQRPYRWGKEQITNLINDFYKNKYENNQDGPKEEYFVGSVVLVGKGERGSEYDVIDGQQRLTTVFLLNYIRFLIQRSRIEEMIQIRKTNLEAPLQELEKNYVGLIGSYYKDVIHTAFNKIITLVDQIDNSSDEEKKNEYFDEIYELYRDAVKLPKRDFTDMSVYMQEYTQKQNSFWNKEKIALSYSRNTCNKVLIQALSKVNIIVSKDKSIQFVAQEASTEDEKQYINALKIGFEELVQKVDNTSDFISTAKNFINEIKNLIDNIKFCAIMTGNERDAYVLFEVLNDRALAIDDLELIKNLFLKEYTLKSGDDDDTIEANINEIDKMWSDEVFTSDLGVERPKLISYLGAVYLTASDRIAYKAMVKYRNEIEDNYLKNYDYDTKKYTFQKVYNDIKVYKLIRKLIETFGLRFDGDVDNCLKAENDINKSIVFKTVKLLKTLKMEGVLAAITNMILKQYCDDSIGKNNGNINVDEFENYLKKMIDDHNHRETDFETIYKWSHKIYTLVLLNHNYERPRELAKKIIQNVSINQNEIARVVLGNNFVEDSKNDFSDWSSKWIYGTKGDQELRLKILFIKLFRTSKQGNELLNKPTVYSFRTEFLQLDHLEANKKDPNAEEKYFEPTNPRENREMYVHSLGNMMILDSINNNKKKNRPIINALEFYNNMCSHHWLIEEIKDMLASTEYTRTTNGITTPNEEFFKERKQRLQKYFLAILDFDINKTQYSI